MVMVQTTPKNTPLAITMPISLPRVRLMVHIARKPAMVVRDDAVIEVKVLQIARTIASSLGQLCFSSS